MHLRFGRFFKHSWNKHLVTSVYVVYYWICCGVPTYFKVIAVLQFSL